MIDFCLWSVFTYLLTVLIFFTYEWKQCNDKKELKNIFSNMYMVEFIPYINTLILLFIIVFFIIFFGSFYFYVLLFELSKIIKYKKIRKSFLQKFGF